MRPIKNDLAHHRTSTLAELKCDLYAWQMAYSRPRDASEIRFLANIDHLRIATDAGQIYYGLTVTKTS